MSDWGLGASGDGELLNALAAGSEAAFETAYDRFAPAMLRAAQSITAQRANAEDAVQEAFVGLVRTGERAREIRNLRAYLITAAVRSAARRNVRERDGSVRLDQDIPANDLPAKTTQKNEDERSPRLERALQSLPQEQRETVALHIDGGLTFDEIAEALGVSANTVGSRYRYALDKLRTALEAKEPSREAASHG